MFATGTHEGGVHIWTIPSKDQPAIPISASNAQQPPQDEKAVESVDSNEGIGLRTGPLGESDDYALLQRVDSDDLSSASSESYSEDSTLMYEDGRSDQIHSRRPSASFE